MEELRAFYFDANKREAVRALLLEQMESHAVARLLKREDVNIADAKAIIDNTFAFLRKEFDPAKKEEPSTSR